MSDDHNEPIKNILHAIEKFIRKTEDKKVYANTHDVLIKIKTILELVPMKASELVIKIGKERFRRVLLQLANILNILQRYTRDDPEYSHRNLGKTTYQNLNDLTIELIRLEIDLTPDLTLKRQRLTDILNKKLYNSMTRQTQLRLRNQFLETNITIEKQATLQRLYQKHGQIINMYQRQCLIDHSSIKIGGLEKGVHHVLQRVLSQSVSSYDLSRLSEKASSLEFPLQNIYIHLKADLTSSYERSQAQKQLHSHSVTLKDDHMENNFRDDVVIDKDYDKEILMALKDRPIMSSLEKQYDSNNKQNLCNVVTVLQRSRWTVVIGDPGSGKTTFVRWMARVLTSDLISKQNMYVPINKSKNSTDDLSTIRNDDDILQQVAPCNTDLGIKQLPLLVRVGEFAEALNNKPELTLNDYLGEHTWMGNSILALPPDISDKQKRQFILQFKLAIQDYIENGCAFIILDGLDEISAGARRRKIVQLIEDFTHMHVQTPNGRSVFDEYSVLANDIDEDIPILSGGNQILITSRIVGYHVEPLSGNFAHFTVSPLEIAYIQQFIHCWSTTICNEIIKVCNLKDKNSIHDIQEQGKTIAHTLETQIDEKTNSGLFSLATNPSLLSLLCTLAFKTPNTMLPEKRIRLYYATVQSLANIWKEKNSSNVPSKRFDHVLGDVAAYIHENSASGLIEESDLKRICTESLAELGTIESEANLKVEINEYFEAFRRNNGVLLQRGQYLYGFSHLTFQEYYACINLVNADKLRRKFQKEGKKTFSEQLAAVFNQHLADPRYHVILSLGLGWVSWWMKNELEPCCEQLLQSENVMNQQLPLAALLLISSTRDLVNLPPDDTLMKALNQLLTASTEYRWYRDYIKLQREMADGINALETEFVRKWVILILHDPLLPLSKDKVFALCHVLSEAALQAECKRKVKSNMKSEQGVNKLQIPWSDAACYEKLTKYLEHDNEEWEYAVDSLLTIIATVKPDSVFTSSDSLRKTFMSNRKLLTKCHPLLMVVIIALYGGLYREENHNAVEGVRYGRHRPGITYKIRFSPLHMHRESVLTPVLQCYLSNTDINSLYTDLTRYLQRIQSNDISPKAIDSFIALFCLKGVQSMWIHEQYRTFAAYEAAAKRFKRILVYLRQFYFMYLDLENVSIPSIGEDEDTHPQEDFDIDLQQAINNLLGYLNSSSSLTTEHFLTFLQAAASARVRLCTTLQSFLNPGGFCKINHVEMNLPDAFAKPNYVDDLVVKSSEEHCLNLPYFIRLLWTFVDKSFNSEMGAEGPFKQKCTHRDFMPYHHDRHFSYALAFVADYFFPIYACLIESHQMSCIRDDMDWYSNQLPFIHVLFECTLNLMSPIYYNKEETLQECLHALTPILNAYGLQSIQTAVALKLETRINTKHSSSQFRSLDLKKKTAYESVERERGEVEKLINVINHDIQQTIDNRLYVSSICLSFLYLALDMTDVALILAIEQAVLKIANPILKLDALTIVTMNLSQSATYGISERPVQEQILENIRSLQNNSPPLISCLLIMKSIAVFDKGSTKKSLLLDVLNSLDLLANENQKNAVLTAAIGIQIATCTPCPTLSYLTQHSSVQYLPYFKTGALQKILDSDVMSRFFLSEYSSDSSIPVLLYSMYLAELSHDIQVIQRLSGTVKTSVLFEDFPNTLTYARATVINEILRTDKQRSLLHDIAEQMNEVTTVEPRALHVVPQWLMFSKDEQRRTFSYYGALLLCENDVWSNTTAVGIVCDLLVNNDDRFRKRAIKLVAPKTLIEISRESSTLPKPSTERSLSSKRQNSPSQLIVKQSSSVIGTEALVILMTRWLEYRSRSVTAAFFLSQMFDTLIIDDVLHLEKIMDLEWQRLSDESDNALSRKRASFFTLLGQVSSSVLDCFLSYLSRILDNNFGEEANHTKHLFHKNLLKIASAQFLKAIPNPQEKSMLCELLWHIAKNSLLHKDLRLVAVESLAYSKSENINNLLYITITDQPKDFSDELISTAIHSYCHTVDRNALDHDVLLDLLQHRSQSISSQVNCELVLVASDLCNLLDLIDNDYKRCYDCLLNCCYLANDHCEIALTNFIESQPEPLLGWFLIDLLGKISDLINEQNYNLANQYFVLKTAILLFQKMPASTCMDASRLDIMNKLKDILYLTSKTHDVSFRISFWKMISFFRELTPDLCDMIMAAELDTADVRKAAEDCVLQIQKVSQGAVENLIEYLSNESFAIRSRAGTVLIQLVQTKVLTVAPVQKAFLNVINRMNDEKILDKGMIMMHKRFIHNLLVKMYYSNAITVDQSEGEYDSDETPRSIDGKPVVSSNRSNTNWHLEDFKVAERSAPYGFCLISGGETRNNEDIGNMRDFSADDWSSHNFGDIDEDEMIQLAVAESLKTFPQ